VIFLSTAIIREIQAAAERAYPEECCGLLIGHHEPGGGVRIVDIAESINIAPPPRRNRFEIDPSLRFALVRRLRGTGADIVGHYHSHPDGTAAPSPHDAAMAFEPELIWLIVAVATTQAGGVCAYQFDTATTTFLCRPITVIS
jgi:desampylase